MPGITVALRTVVSARSNSRTSGSTSVEVVTAIPGRASRRISAVRCSCAGLANACSRQTATASMSIARSASAAASTLASSSGVPTAPPARMRSSTSRMRDGGTGRVGFTQV